MLKDFASTIEVDIKLCWGSNARTQEQRMGDLGSRMPVSAGCHERREQTQGRAIAVK